MVRRAGQAEPSTPKPTGHVDTPPYRKAANEWLNRWLRNDRTPFDESGIVQGRRGDASPCSMRYPADAMNEGIHRTLHPRPQAARVEDARRMEPAPREAGRRAPRQSLPRRARRKCSVRSRGKRKLRHVDQQLRGLLQRRIRHGGECSCHTASCSSLATASRASRPDLRERRAGYHLSGRLRPAALRLHHACRSGAEPARRRLPDGQLSRASITKMTVALLGGTHRVDAGVGYSTLGRLSVRSGKARAQRDLGLRPEADGRASRCTPLRSTTASPA